MPTAPPVDWPTAPPATWSAPAPAPGPAPGGGGSSPLAAAAAVVVVVAVLVATVVGVGLAVRDDGDPTVAPPAPTTSTEGPGLSASPGPTTVPPSTVELAPEERLRPLPPDPGTTGDHEFLLFEADGDPVTWDPCDPIRYVVNRRTEPPGGDDLLREAVARVEAVTGLVFEFAGETDEPPHPDADRPRRDAARYGPGWSPVLVSWTDPSEVAELEEEAVGLALALTDVEAGGEEVYVSGTIEMHGPYAATEIAAGRSDVVLGILMHELGHLVGLDHVVDPTEVMTDDAYSVPTEWGPGDLQGLYALGQGECWPDE